MRILLVGGSVRNLLLGEPPGDKDFLVTGATEEEFLRRFPKARKVGKAFPVFWLDGSEYAFPRGGTLESDLAARDFTVNALALDQDGDLACHPLALADLRGRVLRPCSPDSLVEDPLRVFRAARFLAVLPGFMAHGDLSAAMRQAAGDGLLAGLAAERVGREALKALAGTRPALFFRSLAETGCLPPWFAELERCRDVPAGPPPFHDSDVFGHTLAVLERLDGKPVRGWMALCHDLGKALTPPGEWPRHIGHEKAGAAQARALGERLRLPEVFIRAGETASLLHMKAARYAEMRPGSRVDFLSAAGNLLEPLLDLALADQGADVRALALADREAADAVRLPEGLWNLGPESGRKLRELRAQAISAVNH